MNIDIIISADDIKEEKIKDKSIVVIDILRATSVIITALNNGCKEVVPVVEIEEALEKVKNNRENYILGGERKALKIEGFDCSNSPLEYKSELVKGKTLVITTSNGTRAIKEALLAKDILIGALINGKAVAEKLISLKNDVVIINAGTYGEFSIDDFICSGYIIDCIAKDMEVKLSDISKVAKYLYNMNTNMEFIKEAKHFKRIMELGLFMDLEYCCKKDIVSIVPQYKNGIIK
ncbi:2-phosphosulfolactate phosphatase family protein [Clostridium tetani]|nr:2-phosphosulfolactate phosphatase family protein [Clostridium tetani]